MNFFKKYFKSKKSEKRIRAEKGLTVGKNTVLLENISFRHDTGAANRITIGDDCMIGCNFIFESDTGEVEIGDRVFINGGVNIITKSKITFGNDVVVAWDCTFYDHNSHSIDFRERQKDIKQQIKDYKESGNPVKNKKWDSVKSRPIKICEKAWIGFGSTILNGVTIGEGAIVGAKSVVREDVEPWTIVAGNPARIIKRIAHE